MAKKRNKIDESLEALKAERRESLELLATWKACQKNKNNNQDDEVTKITYGFHYVPLIIIALSIFMIVLLYLDVFAFCSAEVITEIWAWTIVALIASLIAYMAVRTSTKDVDLIKYEHIPLMNRRRRRIIEWCEKFESPEFQLERLQGAFERGTLVEIFLKKRDKKAKKGILNYISIEDVTLTKKCDVREISEDVYYEDDYDSIENAKIVASYKCLEDLVADGWIINEEMYDY
jgi:heme/copper-type cytochrome/quinol oxidase subunit 2